MRPQSVLILGAGSGIARALAMRLAEQGVALHLGGRDLMEMERVATDIIIRTGAKVSWDRFDALDSTSHAGVLQRALDRRGHFDCAVIAFGDLGDQAEAETRFDEARRLIEINFTAAVSVLTHLASYFAAQQRGMIVALGSVAGDRGRPSNYVYGSAKGGLAIYLEGLRARMAREGVSVLTIKAGFVDTRMTFGRSKMFLVASPDQAATAIRRAIWRNAEVAYVPWFWAWIMWVIRAIPTRVFKRLAL